MIFRRLADAVRQENWFSVVLEILIVVVGIFIGLQVDDWNEARKERVEERAYLDRLYSDLTVTIGEINESISQLDARYAYGQKVIQVFQQGELGDVPIEDFERGMIVAARSELVVPQLSSIDELIASGRLGIIRNRDLRAAIAETNTEARRQQAYVALLAGRTEQLIPVIFTRMRRFRIPGQRELDVDYDLDQLMADKEFQNAIGNVIHFLTSNSLWLEDLASQMNDLRDQVGRELGREPAL